MIETLTMFTLGFAIASLLPMVVVPCVHGRAERLTISDRSVRPVSIADPKGLVARRLRPRLYKRRWLSGDFQRRRNNE
jgi:hypothetical protein